MLKKLSPSFFIDFFSFCFLGFFTFTTIIYPESSTSTGSSTEILLPEDFQLSTEVDKDQISIGEKIQLTVTLAQPRNHQFEPVPLPLINQSIGNFVVKSYEIINLSAEKSLNELKTNDYYYQKIVYQITSYVVGDQEIPAINLRFKDITLSSAPIPVTINSTLDPQKLELEEEIDDVMTDPNIEGKLNQNFYYLAVGLLVILLLVSVWWYFRSRRLRAPLPFYIIIKQQMKALSKQLPINKNLKKGKKIYYQFYDLVKTFVSNREDNPKIISLTTHQFKKQFKEKRLDNYSFYLELFDYADKIKFTDTLADDDITTNYVDSFQRILNDYQLMVELEKKNNETEKEKI